RTGPRQVHDLIGGGGGIGGVGVGHGLHHHRVRSTYDDAPDIAGNRFSTRLCGHSTSETIYSTSGRWRAPGLSPLPGGLAHATAWPAGAATSLYRNRLLGSRV